MLDDFELNEVPPGHLLSPCPNLRIVRDDAGREFVALDMIAGWVYTAKLGEHPARVGATRFPRRLAIYDAVGVYLAGTACGELSDGSDIHCTFVPTCSGVHYIEARGCSISLGAPDPNASDTGAPRSPATPDLHDARAHATDLGDVTSIHESLFPIAHVYGRGEPVAFVRFTLAQPRLVSLGLRRIPAGAEVFVEDADGSALCGRTQTGSTGEWLSANLQPGTYFARVRTQRGDGHPFVLRYRLSAPRGNIAHALRYQAEQPLGGATPHEHVNGRHVLSGAATGAASRVSLGTVANPEVAGNSVRHTLVGGSEAGLFELDAVTGELFFTGTEADVRRGTTEFMLTVRSDDGGQSKDSSVIVSVTRPETRPPIDCTGRGARISLGRIAAPGLLGAALGYRFVGGNESGLFELDEATGELFFNGDAEDLEDAGDSVELTVRVRPRRH